MDPEQIGRAFVDHYYSIFDTNRPGLASLYQDGSMLTFEGQKVAGGQGIVAKLTSLAFQQCKHNVSTVDCQLSGPGGGMLVFVNGNMQLPGEEHPLRFTQVYSWGSITATQAKENYQDSMCGSRCFTCCLVQQEAYMSTMISSV